MLKAFCKNLIWVAAPLALAVGCASNQARGPQGDAFSALAPDQTLVATSAHVDQGNRVYTTDEAIGTGNAGSTSDVNMVPSGTNPGTWAIAQEIQDKLIADPTLAPMGSSLITQVSNDGVVTLRGSVASADEQQRVADSISSLPGVRSVNNQLTIGRASTRGSVNFQNPE